MKEILKEIIVSNQNALPADVKIHSWEIPMNAGKLIKKGEKVCNYGYAFKSIIGFGKMIILESVDEKINGLNKIIKHQTAKETVYNFTEEELKNVCVYKMIVEEFTGKGTYAKI